MLINHKCPVAGIFTGKIPTNKLSVFFKDCAVNFTRELFYLKYVNIKEFIKRKIIEIQPMCILQLTLLINCLRKL